IQHEILVEPCGYSNIAIVRASETVHTAVATGAAASNTGHKSKERWLIFVDKKRGLLGRTVVTCPVQDDTHPGRRRSLGLSARPTPPAVSSKSLSGRELAIIPRAVDLPQVSGGGHDVVQCRTIAPEVQSGRPSRNAVPGLRDGAHSKRRISLPLLTENAEDKSSAAAWSASAHEGIISGVGEHGIVKGAATLKPIYGTGVDDGQRTVGGSWQGGDSFGVIAGSEEETGSSFITADIEGSKGSNAEILLNGLRSPCFVAVPVRGSKGVFFIDQAPLTSAGQSSSLSATTAADGPPGTHTGNQTLCGERSQQTRAQSWQLRFLCWGAEQAITLVEDLHNPIAMCVGGSDSSVFVLEEMHERRPLHRGNKRYTVSRLVGSCFSEWFNNGEISNNFVASSRQPTTHNHEKRTRKDSSEPRAQLRYTAPSVSSTELTFDESESETDWDSSSTISEISGLVEHRNQDMNASSIGACAVKKKSHRPTNRSRSRRTGLALVEVLEFSSLARDGDRSPEHPVDLCVLREGTIVVALSRSAPLHDGVSIAESHGVLRAFPAHDEAKTPGYTDTRETSSMHVAEQTLAETSGTSYKYPVYFDGDGWVVAEGLPVITGLAAGGGDAVYLSFCGARHDGAVTAIGSLSIRRSCSLRVRRDDFRGRTQIGSGGEAVESEPHARGGNNVQRVQSRGKFVRIASGYAAAVTVDDKMNLFYVAAESTGTCCALWCSISGVGNRSAMSLLGRSPTLSVTAAGVLSTSKGVPAVSAERAVKVAQDTAGDGKQTTRAIALSMALVEDAEAALTSRTGATHLFALRRHSRCNGQAREVSGMGENEQSNSGGNDTGGSQEASNGPVNIAVVSRCRPLLTREMKLGVKAAVFCDGDEVVVSDETLPKRSRRFGFDRVFGPGTSQARVYAETVCPVVRKMLDGYNCSVLAYGQTGSGKTFTMEGGLVDPTTAPAESSDASTGDSTSACEVEKIGIIPRAVHTIFREGCGGGTRRYWVYVSHMEIYNERLFDLLAPDVATTASTRRSTPSPRTVYTSCRSERSPTRRTNRKPSSDGDEGGGVSGARGKGLTIEEDRQLGVIVKGLTQVEVKSPEEIFAIIARSKSTRRTAETMCNVESSRSHGVFCVRVISAEPMPWGGEITRDGRLSLVDLSGSENIKRSGAVGDRAKEAAAIGQSLLALGRVIKALVQHAPHIPYRESKLTRVLGDSLGGSAFTTIILNITPNNGMLDETLNTLAYAKTAQSVRNTPKQHITNKAPTDEATTGGGAANSQVSEATNLSCNIANELRRWRGRARSRCLSSGSRRGAHVRPWESAVPIRAPPSTSSSNVVPSGEDTTHDQPREDQRSGHHRFRGTEATSSSQRRNPNKVHTKNPQSGKQRPATAGSTRTSLLAGAGAFFSSKVGPHPEPNVHSRSLAKGSRVSGPTQRLARGERVVDGSAVVRHTGLVSNESEEGLTKSEDHRPCETIEVREFRLVVPSAGGRALTSEREAVTRVFDSTAAEWVHTIVLQREADLHAVGSCKARQMPVQAAHAARAKVGNSASAAQEKDSLNLTSAAKKAAQEIFDRYICGAPGRGFLRSHEIVALEEIWIRPDAEPPPPRLAQSSSGLLSQHPRNKAPQTRAVSFTDRGSTAGGSLGKLASGDIRDTRVLSRDAFTEFCRHAAARDAIFIRYFFARSGYDHRLELTPLPRDNTTGARAAEDFPATSSSPPRLKNTPIPSANRKSKDMCTAHREEAKYVVGGSGRREGREKQRGRSRVVSRRNRSLDGGNRGREGEAESSLLASRSLTGYVDKRIQPLTTGGLVDAAELWLWTEDERDHGEREQLDGLLSRGGGAHISRAAATAVVGAFSG
ncbi:unnamed protein product, partial [Scytosiphon promiscuus]